LMLGFIPNSQFIVPAIIGDNVVLFIIFFFTETVFFNSKYIFQSS
jgi:hypothetical protein